MDKNHRARIIFRAERLERATKAPGQRSGTLGQSGLALLRCLLFRFGDHVAPSYKAIQRATGFCCATISEGLSGTAAPA